MELHDITEAFRETFVRKICFHKTDIYKSNSKETNPLTRKIHSKLADGYFHNPLVKSLTEDVIKRKDLQNVFIENLDLIHFNIENLIYKNPTQHLFEEFKYTISTYFEYEIHYSASTIWYNLLSVLPDRYVVYDMYGKIFHVMFEDNFKAQIYKETLGS
ncbi:hypothetical protein [Pedobacter sp. SL55]|uniref:hypothetical protein n=1 Tax=Pedobacter sp. SL55 TaxID=2995161 RepID=UPI00226E5F4B|nr:hypothetical protein [Pedobacter sp. SL55]WAC40221.1 hypothetical protein OVA16_16840 [Pedobacter sp. SL55]